MVVVRSILGAAAMAAILLAASSDYACAEDVYYNHTVDGFKWSDRGCVALINGGNTKEVIDGADKVKCGEAAIAERIADVGVDVFSGLFYFMGRPDQSKTYICWRKDFSDRSVTSTTCVSRKRGKRVTY